MAQIHLRSIANISASRARVYLNTARGETHFANIFRAEGFWNVQSVNGTRLLPLMPHTAIHKGEQIDTPMGVIIKLLRERVTGALAAPVTNAPAA